MICLTILLTAKDAADVPRLRDLLTQAMRKSRAEPGCLRFDVYHSSADPRRFTLDSADDAHDAIRNRSATGKIVVEIAD